MENETREQDRIVLEEQFVQVADSYIDSREDGAAAREDVVLALTALIERVKGWG